MNPADKVFAKPDSGIFGVDYRIRMRTKKRKIFFIFVCPDRPISFFFDDNFPINGRYKTVKKIGRSGLLPAGAIFTGEAAHSKGIDELARKELGLPTKVAKNFIPGNFASKQIEARTRERLERARDPEWSVALGLCVLGLMGPGEESLGIRVAKRTKSGIIKFLRQFLP